MNLDSRSPDLTGCGGRVLDEQEAYQIDSRFSFESVTRGGSVFLVFVYTHDLALGQGLPTRSLVCPYEKMIPSLFFQISQNSSGIRQESFNLVRNNFSISQHVYNVLVSDNNGFLPEFEQNG